MTVHVQVDFRPAMLPVRDQGPRPTCCAQAATAAHEHCRADNNILSPEYLHFHATRVRRSRGSSFKSVSGALKKNGQPLEIDCPYFPSPPAKNWSPTPVNVFRRDSSAGGATPLDIAVLLKKGIAPLLGVTIPWTFYTPSAPWIIEPDGTEFAKHVVVGSGLGTIDSKLVVLIRNSWGKDWGEDGYAWLTERFLTQHLQEVMYLTTEVVA